MVPFKIFTMTYHDHDLRNVFCSPQCGLVPSQQASSMPRAKRSSNPMNTTQIYTATSSYKQLQSGTPCKFQMSQEVLLNTTWKFVTSFQSSLCVRGESWRFLEILGAWPDQYCSDVLAQQFRNSQTFVNTVSPKTLRAPRRASLHSSIWPKFAMSTCNVQAKGSTKTAWKKRSPCKLLQAINNKIWGHCLHLGLTLRTWTLLPGLPPVQSRTKTIRTVRTLAMHNNARTKPSKTA